MTNAIAIVGMACRYPDAQSPVELWENTLAGRRAFRRIPPERLRVEDYLPSDRNNGDSIYPIEAALIDGYEFDRVRFRVAGSTFRSADLAHWLALDIATQALADAGFAEGDDLPRETTGVILGNTLTGEFARANLMRLRWPYVRRVLEPILAQEGFSPDQLQPLLEELETAYKKPFPPVGEETLAGGLSNTIAGRICNHFNLKGGGYTVDGACASSLLAIATACSSLAAGDLDVALAGGVDLSLDPFELVGFAKTSALAPDEMRVFDARSSGFWPGEGCGFIVLMRHKDAVAQGRRIYATICGWGVSSDGSGGITRPDIDGQLLAINRAYRRAGYGIDGVTYFEGHGTGTSVGDSTELRALAYARRQAGANAPPAFISSIKANIGHTKAAAGVAGIIKTALALHSQILPPIAGCKEPHPELAGKSPALQVLSQAMAWPQDRPVRASVSAMGFGGINTHVALEKKTRARRKTLNARERAIITSAQDSELFLLGAVTREELEQQIAQLQTVAPRLSRAEMADLAAQLESSLNHRQVRAAIVAETPAELAEKLEVLKSWPATEAASRLDARAGIFLGSGDCPHRIGLLFPGQGSPANLGGGALRRRFDIAREVYARNNLPETSDTVSTEIAQPAIITASLAALRVLDRLGIGANIVVGHSLGEIAALHYAGGFDEEALLRIATVRGKAMAMLGDPTGAMASISASGSEVAALLDSQPVVIAGLNSPVQTVISGEAAAVAAVVSQARSKGLSAVMLPVSHAFHSPHISAAAPALEQHLRQEQFYPLRCKVVSTVTGAVLEPDADLKDLLYRQVTSPVRFLEAIHLAAEEADLFLEVGPGRILTALTSDYLKAPVIAIDAGGPSLKGLLQALGAAFAIGASVKCEALFAGRYTKPFDLNRHPKFFVNPCELAPLPAKAAQTNGSSFKPANREAAQNVAADLQQVIETVAQSTEQGHTSILDLVRQMVAQRAELPASVISEESRMLSDLHLNSITVSHLIGEAARRLGVRPPLSLTDYADATLSKVAQVLENASRDGRSGETDDDRPPAGVDSWIRPFTVEMIERPLPRRMPHIAEGASKVIAAADDTFGRALSEALETWTGGSATVVCLPPRPDERHIDLLLEGARAVSNEPEPTRFVLVQHGGGASAFAKTLHLETSGLTTCVIDLPPEPQSVDIVLAEMRAATGYTEAHYDKNGCRRVPVLRALDVGDIVKKIPLDSSDVLLATGGGKGITAECAIALARKTKASLILLGLSQPEADFELANNLERMAAAGINFKYVAADITDRAAVESALSEAVKATGPVTAILHGAALNIPKSLRTLDRDLFMRTIATKVGGARNVLSIIDPARLKLFIAFGSTIGRTGLPGEAHYGLANEWLTRLTEEFKQKHPECFCLSAEWSVWSGVGMAQRIGGIERLIEAGITPITPENGVSMLDRLLTSDLPSTSVVVTGRFGELETLQVEQPDLPLLRFIEKPRVFYPGVELIVDCEINGEADPYILDHVLYGERLFPAVLGLEAMAQVASALAGSDRLPVFEEAKFSRPIVIAGDRSRTIRIAALIKERDRVEVSLRSDETDFQVDHFKAIVNFDERAVSLKELGLFAKSEVEAPALPIDPAQDLYGGILFHEGRFRRLQGYRKLRAKECIAQIAAGDGRDWFDRYHSSELILGDPGMRDTTIHAIQACIPHLRLLPVAVDRLTIFRSNAGGGGFVCARERERDGDSFIYDVEVTDNDKNLIERWEGLRLHAISNDRIQAPRAEPLLGPYIERRISEMISGVEISAVIELDSEAQRRARSDRAIKRAVGQSVPVFRRADGKPEVASDLAVSATHSNNMTFAVAGPQAPTCDVESVRPRSTIEWRDLLGAQRFKLAEVIARQAKEDHHRAATRVWTATECLKKAGAAIDAPLVVDYSTTDGWVLLTSGRMIVATLAAEVRGNKPDLAIGVLVRRDDASI